MSGALFSGEFDVTRLPAGTYLAQVLGDDDAHDLGECVATTPGEALQGAIRDYLRELHERGGPNDG